MSEQPGLTTQAETALAVVNTYDAAMRQLLVARRAQADVEARVERARAAWTAAQQGLLEAQSAAQAATADAEAAAATAALALAAQRGGAKTLEYGTVVATVTSLRYDPARAVTWAIERKATECLALAKLPFEKAARLALASAAIRTTSGIDFVTEAKALQARLPNAERLAAALEPPAPPPAPTTVEGLAAEVYSPDVTGSRS